MPLTAEDLEELAAKIREREAKIERELADAESKTERDELLARLEKLEAREQELEAELADAGPSGGVGDQGGGGAESAADDDDDAPVRKARTRPGRKRGQIYQDEPGGAGRIWDKDDEPDRVPIDDDDGESEAA
jgi:hypothetical protein